MSARDDKPEQLTPDAERELLDVLDAAARRLLHEALAAEARGDVTHAISGELHDELLHATALDDGEGERTKWGYGVTRAVDVEVHTMTHAGVRRKHGVGHRVRMTGSLDAWRAIAEYARDRSEMESTLVGDFGRGMGKRLSKQAERIDALVNTHTKES